MRVSFQRTEEVKEKCRKSKSLSRNWNSASHLVLQVNLATKVNLETRVTVHWATKVNPAIRAATSFFSRVSFESVCQRIPNANGRPILTSVKVEFYPGPGLNAQLAQLPAKSAAKTLCSTLCIFHRAV